MANAVPMNMNGISTSEACHKCEKGDFFIER